MLSFIAGEVPPELGWHEDAVLMEAARLIRRYHDAVAPLATAPDEVICHNDLSPCNFVFRDGQPTAMIDFDAAAPGSRAFDLGYAAWLWLNLGNADIGGAEQRRRLELFSAAYGGFDASDLLAAILTRQELLVAEGQRTGNTLTIGWAEACLAWTQQHLVLS